MNVYVVSLPSAVERRSGLVDDLDVAGIAHQVFDAVDGRKGDARAPFPLEPATGRYGFKRSTSELGCFASHYLLWQKCVALGEPIVVLEDDVRLGERAAEAMQLAGEQVGPDFIRLVAFFPQPAVVLRSFGNGFDLIQHIKGPAGTEAYVIGPAAARKFLERADPILDPVDEFMDRFWENDVRCLGLVPNAIQPGEIGSSIVRSNQLRGLAKFRFKVEREIEGLHRRRWLRGNLGDAALAKAVTGLADGARGTRRARQFGIKPGYKHRIGVSHFDDTALTDEYQAEVYAEAARMAVDLNMASVADVGCGSGYKLLKHFRHLNTVGYEVEPTLSALRRSHPDREWRLSDVSVNPAPADLVICADVIEHVEDPDNLLYYLTKFEFTRLVLSTPDRTLMYGRRLGGTQSGPPANPHHYREWTFGEFSNYIGRWFEIESHVISNREQATQMVVCSKRR